MLDRRLEDGLMGRWTRHSALDAFYPACYKSVGLLSNRFTGRDFHVIARFGPYVHRIPIRYASVKQRFVRNNQAVFFEITEFLIWL